MKLTYRENYFNDAALKHQFISFLNGIFGLDLSQWDAAGFWSDNYHVFSYFADDRVVSSVCLYSMNMTVGGRQCKVAQLSGVGTLPEFRKQGLSQKLTEKAVEWASPDHDFSFLFANTDALTFYKKCGFRRFTESKTVVELLGRAAKPGAVRLDMERVEHRQLALDLASRRQPVSDVLGTYNPRLFMYWCLYGLRDHVYYIADLDMIVLYKRENGLVKVFDIVSAHMPAFEEIYRYISAPSDKHVEFHFVTDKLRLHDAELVPFEDNFAHLLGGFPLETGRVMFPFTGHA